MITKALAEAYYATDYIVFLENDEDLVLPALGFSPGLESLMKEEGVSSCAFITAYNPESKETGDDENRRGQAALMEEVSDGGWTFYEGHGKHPSSNWPAEPSILIMGIDLDAARALGLRYRQNAFVFGTADGRTALIASNEQEQYLLSNLKDT